MERERNKSHHEKLFKASLNPTRRKMVHTIGVFGKTIEELKQEMKLDDFLFKFNLDFLIQNGFIEEKDGKLKLTQDGIELLESG